MNIIFRFFWITVLIRLGIDQHKRILLAVAAAVQKMSKKDKQMWKWFSSENESLMKQKKKLLKVQN